MSLRAITVSLSRRGRPILDRVSLDVVPGRFTVLLGPNGAGKSTLFRLLSGDIAPESGRVLLDGVELHRWRADALAQRRAVLPQDTPMALAFTAREVAAWGGRSLPPQELERAVEKALLAVEAVEFANRPVPLLSGGERRRVHLARALVQLHAAARHSAAPILLLDEPTAGLDLRHQHLILRLAADLARGGAAVAAVLHDLDLAAAYADEVVMLEHGRIHAHGEPEGVLVPAIVDAVYRVRSTIQPCPETGRPRTRVMSAAST